MSPTVSVCTFHGARCVIKPADTPGYELAFGAAALAFGSLLQAALSLSLAFGGADFSEIKTPNFADFSPAPPQQKILYRRKPEKKEILFIHFLHLHFIQSM
jgi:hypothetical protein